VGNQCIGVHERDQLHGLLSLGASWTAAKYLEDSPAKKKIYLYEIQYLLVQIENYKHV
jgi:hypothetical protein